MTKEGVYRPRILLYAKLIQNVIEQLKPLTRRSNLVSQNIIKNHVKIEARKLKIPQSIVGEELATREVKGVIELYEDMYKTEKEIKKLAKKRIENKIKKKEYIEEVTLAENIHERIFESINLQLDEYQRYAKIQKEYEK